jgi:large subunit ribosomal protein L15
MSMIHDITAAVPRYKRRKRKGRGESSGMGKTSGRGTKGSGARQGQPSWKPGHEGGQTPLHRRLPTRGFSNDNFETNWYIVNVSDLNRFDDGATVDSAALQQAKLVRDDRCDVKVLGDGSLTKRLTVVAGWYSKSAHEKITAAGGAAHNLKGEPFQFPKPKKKFVKREQPKKKDKAAAAAAAEAPAAVEAAAPAAAEAAKPAEGAAE